MEIIIGIVSSFSTASLIGLAVYLSKNWLLERLKLSLQKEHTEFLDKLNWERKQKEQAAKVAEYLAFVNQLSETDDKSEFIRANQLSWELAMWLPDEIYREVTNAIINRSETCNELTAVMAVRNLLLEKQAGSLNQDQIAVHAPGIGKIVANKAFKSDS
ncbi:hypothetical protein [Vibrio natriegens]|uniref:hypothetical protein n=1 Tax=Vibrio natriegens TaxID=691 RepID=UPI001FBA6DB7|nr:hypothetical protein [Vibrio natriegens]